MRTITICGSMRFYKEMLEEQIRLSNEGNVVILPIVGFSDPTEITDEEHDLYSKIHFQKIDMADEIFVMNVGGYVGKHTAQEISYASRTGKPVRFLESEERLMTETLKVKLNSVYGRYGHQEMDKYERYAQRVNNYFAGDQTSDE